MSKQLEYVKKLNNLIENVSNVEEFISLYKEYFNGQMPSNEMITQYKNQCANASNYDNDSSYYDDYSY